MQISHTDTQHFIEDDGEVVDEHSTDICVHHKNQDDRKERREVLREYKPVMVLIATATITGYLLTLYSQYTFMTTVMGLVLIQFATLKLFDIEGFQEAFQRYDVIAKRWPQYGEAYPGIELLLGLAFLALPLIPYAAILTCILMSVSAYSVTRALLGHKDVRCACVGSSVDVPLGAFSLVETLGMALMSLIALGMLYM